MMATACPLSTSSLLPLLESLEDSEAEQSDQTDAYLTIANRLSGEEGRQFLPAVEKNFPRLGKAILTHISSPNAELCQAALQALGFCVYHSHVVSGVSENFSAEIISALCSLVVNSTDKNTCTRALWVISKQSFPPPVLTKKVDSILHTLEAVWTREDVQSVVMEHEALNVIIRMLEQVPAQMGAGAVRWAKLVIPLVVHSASKVRLRAAAAMEMGLPLLLERRAEVSAIIEPIMCSKLIPELQKLFMTKNEANVLKLWPLFVKLLGKHLHKGGPFINALLHLEELGFRSSSPNIKKIAFIAWKSLIDNFALNPDILSSAKRMKLLMQPLCSIQVRTEALQLTKLEVWWYLVVRLGPNLAPHFEQVSVPLLQCTMGANAPAVPCTPVRGAGQSGPVPSVTPKTGTAGLSSPAVPRLNLNSSMQSNQNFPSIQLLGLEMLLHYFLGPEVVTVATRNKLLLTLEPLTHPFLSSVSSFNKHATWFISTTRDGFISVGNEAPDSLLVLIWRSLVSFVSSTIESADVRKERQGSEALTLMFQALQSIVSSEAVSANRVLVLVETTVKGIPPRVLGSASYQVGKMDVLNGTPALFLILLIHDSNMLSAYVKDERFFQCLHSLVGCGLSGPTSPLAFGEAVLVAVGHCAGSLGNKEHVWKMWSTVVTPLTETITQSNEVNQGDALEHNFSAVHAALMFPITHLLSDVPLSQMTQKSMLSTWSKLYKVFARCSSLVTTTEENICCEELCAKMAAVLNKEALSVPSTLNAVSSVLQVMLECVDFSPFTSQFQQKAKSPQTPLNWARKKSKALGNLSTFQALLVLSLEAFLATEAPEATTQSTGSALLSILTTLFTNLALATPIQEALSSLTQPLTLLHKQATDEPHRFTSQLVAKLEKLLAELLGCLQSRSALAYDSKLLAVLSPLLCVLFLHKSKQLRTLVTQFWNATFANSLNLTYPEELRPVLSQVKQKTPIILPGFEALSIPDELSGQYSNESSQLDTKLSGIQVSSVGKRDSLLGRAAEREDRISKPVSTKLDFGSPKPPLRQVLEEDASIDFVFIPPETKERVLTEHQKEVKRTKRVDIPAMYNNLDASLDTTAFTQYTQSQEDSTDKLSTEEQTVSVVKEASSKVHQEEMDIEEEAEMLSKDTQDLSSPKATENMAEKPDKQAETIPMSEDVSMEEDNGDVTTGDLDMEPKEGTSPNVSGSSDLVSGTPQKTNSRRQSFITLEKYSDSKPASPVNVTKFTGPLTKNSNSQERTASCNQDSQTLTEHPKTKEYSDKKPRELLVNPTEGLPSEGTEEDVIADTQTDTENNSKSRRSVTPEQMGCHSQEEEFQSSLEDSQCSQSPPNEPRRSGRQRARPLLPGQDPKEHENKRNLLKTRRSTGEDKGNSPKTSLTDSQTQGRSSRRSKAAAEKIEEDGHRRTRAQKDKGETSQTGSVRASRKIRLFSPSEELLGKDKETPPRRSTRGNELSQTDSQADTQSDTENQSQGGRKMRRRSAVESDENNKPKRRGRPSVEKQEPSQTDSQATNTQSENQSQEKGAMMSKVLSNSEEFEPEERPKKDKVEPSLSESEMESQSSQTDSQSQSRTSRGSKLETESEEPVGDTHSQDDSAILTPTSSDSQLQVRSRTRSKASPDVLESTGKSQSSVSTENENADSQKNTPASRPVGRPRKKVRGQHLNNSISPSVTPLSSQSLDTSGLTDSSNGRSRFSKRRSSQVLIANMETSESDSSENIDKSPSPKWRGRKPKAAPVSSPLTLSNMDCEGELNTANEPSESSQKSDLPSPPGPSKEETLEHQEESLTGGEVPVSPVVITNIKEQCKAESHKEEQEMKCKQFGLSPHVNECSPRLSETNLSNDCASSQEIDVVGYDSESLKAEEIAVVWQHPEPPCAQGSSILDNKVPAELSSPQEDSGSTSDTQTSSGETREPLSLQVLESSEEKVLVALTEDADSIPSEPSSVPAADEAEATSTASAGPDNMDHSSAADEPPVEEEQLISMKEDQLGSPEKLQGGDIVKDVVPQEEEEEDQTPDMECEEETQIDSSVAEVISEVVAAVNSASGIVDAAVPLEAVCSEECQDSPAKHKGVELLMGAEVAQSPGDGKTKGSWSPSASPSNSILKKGQKRLLEEEATSPLTKSRRVSFADPIQHQELADDIDRRSPIVRTSSPKRSKIITSIPQPKYVSTPTKGLLILSPRNLHGSGFKSSKKCLISEISKEPRAIPKDCVYPALVGCSAPVEAVLPQISSNMWPRGFGKLVRAKNIKTVGDLSALTPKDIKTLPIRSPQISNVKKALKAYEEKRKSRGGDELKSFDEVEKLASELEDTNQNQEDDKILNESLATELFCEPAPGQHSPESKASRMERAEEQPVEEGPGGTPNSEGEAEGLLPELESLASRMTPEELGRCSPGELVQLHEHLGGVMRSVVLELQSRLLPTQPDGKL